MAVDPAGPAAVTEDWRQTILARTEKHARRHRNDNGLTRDVRVGFQCDIEFIKAIDAAARARGISRVGYIRRAVGALAAADLGVDFAELMGGTPMPLPHESTGDVVVGISRGAPDDGAGYGNWRVRLADIDGPADKGVGE